VESRSVGADDRVVGGADELHPTRKAAEPIRPTSVRSEDGRKESRISLRYQFFPRESTPNTKNIYRVGSGKCVKNEILGRVGDL
jgi:hypothetical protein